jgi:hypothetical protein
MMPHKFNIGAVVYYRPKDRMLNTARGTYTITGLMPGLEGQQPEYRIKHFSEEFERVALEGELSVGESEHGQR